VGKIADRYREAWAEFNNPQGAYGRLKRAFLILAGITVLLWVVSLVLKLTQ
jgi:hypothetical protein